MNDLQQRIKELQKTNNGVEPDATWLCATRETLLMQARNSLASEPVRTVKKLRNFYQHFAPSQFIKMVRGPVIVTASILVVVLGASSASVSAAEQSIPGDFFYSLKLVTEQARLAMAPNKEEKLKLKVEFTTRRSDELKEVIKSDKAETPARIQKATEILKRDLNTVKQQLEEVRIDPESQNVIEAAKLVDQTSNELVQALQETKSSLSGENQDRVTEAQAAAADTGVKAIEVLMGEHEESNEFIHEDELFLAIKVLGKTVADATGSNTLISATSSILIAATGTVPLLMKEALAQTKEAALQAFTVRLPVISSSSTDGFVDQNNSVSSTEDLKDEQTTGTDNNSSNSEVVDTAT
ncbi:MAG: DUF5667 domain-containing protein [Patescibacteria group bacterium]|nr:hypothetical protein [Patescibacteria group bacterium]